MYKDTKYNQNKCLDKQQEERWKEISAWVKQWTNWIIQQYHISSLDNFEQTQFKVADVIQQLFDELALGNSAFACSVEDVQILGDSCVYLNSYPQKLEKSAIKPFVFDGQYLMLYRHYLWESQLAKRIIQFSQQQFYFSEQEQQKLDYYQQIIDPQHSRDEHQKQAMQKAISQSFTLITGGPGTGKTFTLAQIIAVLNALSPQIRIAMAAPTGKAAQRMQEALQNALKHLPDELKSSKLEKQQTMTLHRLLGLGFGQKARYHHKKPLPYDVIVVDEASMLGLDIAQQLFDAVPEHCRLILLGDTHQLASVDIGSVLADLQNMPILQNNRENLVKSRRFAMDSKIGHLAKYIQGLFTQHQLDTEETVQQFLQILPASRIEPKREQDFAQLEYIQPQQKIEQYKQTLMQGFDGYVDKLQHYQQLLQQIYPILKNPQHPENVKAQQIIQELCQSFDDYRILTATQKGDFGTESLNTYAEQFLYQRIYQVPKLNEWYIGRAVMMTVNDYQLGLSNGDIGLCLANDNGSYMVYFASMNRWYSASRLPQSIQTAFAMTIHKSQGSEFSLTAVVLDDSAERLLSQELIYTAITRAKRALNILTTEEALKKSLTQKTQRVSRLVEKVKNIG